MEVGVAVLVVAACAPHPAPSDAAAPWGMATVVEELRIGTESGADEYMFGSIRGIAVGVDDTIFVNDRQVGLRSFDENGQFLGNIGRRGQGPGEYTDLRGLATLPDSRLVTLDLGNSRVTLWSRDGEYIDSFGTASLAFEPGAAQVVMSAALYGPGRHLEVDVDGNIYLRSVDDLTKMGSTDDPPQAVYLKLTDNGEPLETLVIPGPEQVPERSFIVATPGGGRGNFPTVTLSAWNPLGFLMVGRNDVYDIELQKPDGPINLRRDIEPTALSAEERAEWDALAAYHTRRAKERGSDASYQPAPTVKPYFRAILAGIDGRAWVLRYVRAERVGAANPGTEAQRPTLTYREPETFDVFEPNGAFLGTVALPHDTRLLAARDRYIWCVHTDTAGVERVLRLRVEPSTEEGT